MMIVMVGFNGSFDSPSTGSETAAFLAVSQSAAQRRGVEVKAVAGWLRVA